MPFVEVESIDDAIRIINSKEKPLAFYVFTEKKSTFEYINTRTSAGGVVHNDVALQYASMLRIECVFWVGDFPLCSGEKIKSKLYVGTNDVGRCNYWDLRFLGLVPRLHLY